MRLLITGAGGFIGARLAALALEAGDGVRTLTRREWDGAPYVPLTDRSFGRLPYDLPDRAFEGVDVVIHCAATADADLARSRAVNVTGTLEVADRARRSGASAFLFFSSQSARPDAPSAYGWTKHQAERALLGLSGIDVIIVRPGLVCGRGGLFGRVTALAERLPIVPVFAADAIVQPIWVDDLARAVLRCARDHATFAGATLSLGAPKGAALGELVREIAARSPKRPRVAAVPYRPVAAAVAIAEAVGLRPALSSTNLKGMRAAREMDTRADMARLTVPERPLAEIVGLAMAPRGTEPARDGARARRVMLVGAGRIGLVHAISLTRLSGAVLGGVVDRSTPSLRLLRSVGVGAPGHTSLERALEDSPDAAVIATPPATHLALVRRCAERGLRVLVEKPASVGRDDAAAYSGLAGAEVLVGYLLPASPHIRAAIGLLRAGVFGRVIGFRAFTLLDLIRAGGPERWETKPEVAGGGVLANSATHVLSLVDAVFGDALRSSAQTRSFVSRQVEDAAVVDFEDAGVHGRLFACWSFSGFERQENRLIVVTDRGELTITTNVWQFEEGGAVVEAGHQLDHDTGFNLAPDYAGGGISTELRELVAPSVDGPAVTLEGALRIERRLHALYETARPVDRFERAQEGVVSAQRGIARAGSPADLPGAALPASEGPPRTGRLVLDLRGRPADAIRAALADPSPSAGPVELDARDLGLLPSGVDAANVRVMIPDFLRHVRRIGERRYAEVLREIGIGGAPAAALAALRGAAGERGVGFWTAASALVAGELGRIPRAFTGIVLLHPYLVDLAVALDRLDRLEPLIRAVARRHRVGLHSNLARETANALALLDPAPELLSVLVSPNKTALPEIRSWLAREPRLAGIHLTAEVGPAPVGLHRKVATDPAPWLPGADSVLVSGLTNAGVWTAARAAFEREWGRAFPGLDPVDGAL